MASINNLINQISFDQADDQIELLDIYQDIHGSRHHIFSFGIKKLFVFLVSLIVPFYLFNLSLYPGIAHVPKSNRYAAIIIFSIALILTVINLYAFFILNRRFNFQYLNCYRHQLVVYLIIQSNAIGYGSLYALIIFPVTKWLLVLSSFTLYLAITITCTLVLIQTAFKAALNEKYGFTIPITTFAKKLQSLIAGAVALCILAVFGYRTFKAFFVINHTDASQIIGGLSQVVKLLGIIIIVLIPALFFDAELAIRSKLLTKYSEKFRQQTNYSSDDWYREDYSNESD